LAPETLIVEEHDHITKITLNRPSALNAINDKMGKELIATLKETEKNETVRCLVITGAGRAFSAGEDVSGLRDRYGAGEHPSLGDHLRKKYHPIMTRIRNIEKPIIARLNGIAAGSGASLALACDIRVVGPGRALELIMTGQTITAKEAEQLGLINKVVPAAELDKYTDELAHRLATGPTKALGLSKRIVNRVSSLELPEALEYEAYNQDIAGRTSDHLEAVKSFLEKRQPKFSGK